MATRMRLLSLAATALAMIVMFSGTSLAQEANAVADSDEFGPLITHPFVPLSSARLWVYEGEEVDKETGETIQLHVEVKVLPETKAVTGVEITVVEAAEYQNGELAELDLAYFAQHTDGTVYYFGEDVDNYENGEVVDHEGSWLAGEGRIQPGVYMPASPEVGKTYLQELSTGVAQDRLLVVALDQPIATPVGHFSGCLRTQEYSTLDFVASYKYYCPGVGLVREDYQVGGLNLIYFEGGMSVEDGNLATPVGD